MTDRPQFTITPSDIPATRADLAWARAAESMQLTALPTIRTSAERWATMMLGVTGLLATATFVAAPGKIPDLAHRSTQIWTGAFFGAAILSAGVAVALAAFASQGRIVDAVPSGPDLQRVTQQQARSARNLLFWSRLVSAICVPMLLLGLATLTYGDQKAKARHIEVITKDGTRLCGNVISSGPATIRIDVASATVTVAISDIRSTGEVAGCS